MDAEELPRAPHTVDDFLRAYEDGGPLRGFRCVRCGLVSATWGLACPRCGDTGRVEQELSPSGKVVSFTIQTVPGDEFLNDAPYAYVVVELDGGGRITGWMPAVRSVSDLEVGDRVRFHPSYKPGVQFVRDLPVDRPGSGG
ncbi:MAG: OB-fold domain-containing protein [Thermoplasmata archaeon]|nr:OB-fold domain-containing protein [Thermoplasmata archaeon]